ncbi:hypothetical protein [Bacillus suaedaesalsae]|uniref:Uncharacterized protein n=1 Tax=Bacillus suaedaesalsae TaxID=2810349 RepID=A0ABS2DFH4_9BACI|nr:hypothetical protein [Bacillus suaedaesalsae]MBM6617227.1 hypothetical protein [Bacillus suaedaesalsae]
MILKEFDLDLPYIADEERIKGIMEKESCQYHDATKMDYELNWKEKRRSFRLETRCVTAMYERLFGKMKNEDCWKILVECVENITEAGILNLSGVVTVQVKFNYDEFRYKNELEKKIATLNLLMEGIEKVANNKSWAFEQFKDVSLQIEQTKYLNEWAWKKAVKNPNKNYYAEVLCQHNVTSMDISIVIKQKNGVEIQREKVISELPDEFAYARHLGELKWLADFEIALINKKGNEMVTVSLDSYR